MQAGLVGSNLTFRDVFGAVAGFLFLVALVIPLRDRRKGLIPHSALTL